MNEGVEEGKGGGVLRERRVKSNREGVEKERMRI
jgi:hypothetical protein